MNINVQRVPRKSLDLQMMLSMLRLVPRIPRRQTGGTMMTPFEMKEIGMVNLNHNHKHAYSIHNPC